jgi:hypothetical protein
MKSSRLATLRFLALIFLLPGLGGLVASAVVSTGYLDSMPKSPTSEELRVVPRNIDGTVVYQTELEDHRLSLIEDSSVGVFLVGLLMGLVYLERWGNERSSEVEFAKDALSSVNSK